MPVRFIWVEFGTVIKKHLYEAPLTFVGGQSHRRPALSIFHIDIRTACIK